MRTTAPDSHGASSRLPATRSFSIDERISAGRPSRNASLLRRRSRRRARTPRARPTRPRLRAAPPRTSRAGPGRCGRRRRAARDAPCSPTSRTGSRTSPTARAGCPARRSTSMPACAHASQNALAAAASPPANAPTTSRAIVPVCAMTPGVADRRRDVRDAAQHVRRARARAPSDVGRVDAVLERNDDAAARDAAARAARPRPRRPTASRTACTTSHGAMRRDVVGERRRA